MMKKWIIIATCICIFLTVTLGIIYIQLIPLLKDYGKMEIERFNQLIISHCYMTDQKQYDDLVIIERNENNEIELIDFDMIKVNQLASQIVLDIEKHMLKLRMEVIRQRMKVHIKKGWKK